MILKVVFFTTGQDTIIQNWGDLLIETLYLNMYVSDNPVNFTDPYGLLEPLEDLFAYPKVKSRIKDYLKTELDVPEKDAEKTSRDLTREIHPYPRSQKILFQYPVRYKNSDEQNFVIFQLI